MPILQSAFGAYPLRRIPHDPTHTLRAWDAADEYLLAHLDETRVEIESPLILNDTFGALGISLHRFDPLLVSDSIVSQLALQANLGEGPAMAQPQILDSLSPLPKASLVIIKQPKSAAYFDYQLQAINHYLPAGTPIIVAAMVKYLSRSFFSLMEHHLDRVHTSLARKKARLIFGTVKGDCQKPVLIHRLDLPEYSLTLCNTPNVFAAGKIDIGSRFFLQHFPSLNKNTRQLVDLGCGNGILGIYALKQNPHLQVTFVDESWHAIHAARCSTMASLDNMAGSSQMDFKVNYCLQGFASSSVDAVLCNPPFHQQQSTGIQVARQMFTDSARVLRGSGALYVIGNRHLNYHLELKKYFRRVQLLASDRKFIMLVASGP